jgi:hypothetical protein
MQLCDSLLQRVRLVHATDALNGDDMFAINAHQREQTRIYSQMVDFSLFRTHVWYLQHDCTRATTSLATSQLGALEVWLCADEIEQSPVWIRIGQHRLLSIDEAADV